MTFAHPWLLLGALAALIPLLVHLFDRRRPRPVPFGAISFVLKSQRRTASRLKLKRLVLYLLRTLFLLAVPLALARPQCAGPQVAVARSGLAATAVVVDTSMALRWRDGAQLFEKAKGEAKAALRELASEAPATVVPCTDTPAPVLALGFDRAPLLSAIDDLHPGYRAIDLNRCLEVAAKALDESPLANRRLVVVSVFARTALQLDRAPPTSKTPKGETITPEVVLRSVAPRGLTALPNRAIVDARAEAAAQLGRGAWQFTFTVRNEGPQPQRDVALRLEVNGETVSKGFVDLAAQGTVQKTLVHQFTQGGTVFVTGALEPDALPEDDTRTLAVTVPKELKALVVNGSPSPQKYRDEAFFTEAALSAKGSPVRAVVRDADAAWREDFAAYDVILLLDVETPRVETATALRRFVEGGGGLFVSFGDHLNAEAWNAAMAQVLPRKVRVVKTAVEPAQPDAQGRGARLERVSATHPVFSPFQGAAREGLMSIRFFRYALFESDEAAVASETLGLLDDGAPVFLASRLGRGRVFVFASSVSRQWCDVPIRTGFLPLMQRATAWLTGTLDERESVEVRVGQPVRLEPQGAVAPALARSPSGLAVPLVAVPGGAAVSGGPMPEPGAYQVVDAKGEVLPELSFAVGLEAAASDLSLHSLDALSAFFGEESVTLAGANGDAPKTPLWTWLLGFAALAFFLEGVLLRR